MPRPSIYVVLASVLLVACGRGVAAGETTSGEVPGPERSPPVYASADKNLTFPTPAGAFYCPMPSDWVGSDHGTVMFLTEPDHCGAGGAYASSERGALDAPNIRIYYGYDVVDDGFKPPSPPCEIIGRAAFLGAERPLCVTRRGEIVEVRAHATYMAAGVEADIRSEAAFTLVTDSGRLQADLETFRRLLTQTGTCNRIEIEGASHPGARPACDPGAVWF